jgi:hypothetical protein
MTPTPHKWIFPGKVTKPLRQRLSASHRNGQRLAHAPEALKAASLLLWQRLRKDDLNLFQQFRDWRGCGPSVVGNGPGKTR